MCCGLDSTYTLCSILQDRVSCLMVNHVPNEVLFLDYQNYRVHVDFLRLSICRSLYILSLVICLLMQNQPNLCKSSIYQRPIIGHQRVGHYITCRRVDHALRALELITSHKTFPTCRRHYYVVQAQIHCKELSFRHSRPCRLGLFNITTARPKYEFI